MIYFLHIYNKLCSKSIRLSSNNNSIYGTDEIRFQLKLKQLFNIKSNKFSIVNTTRITHRILIITNSRDSPTTNELVILLESLRIEYKILLDKSLYRNPLKVSSLKNNIFSLIILDSMKIILDEKCDEIKKFIFRISNFFNIGLIIFLRADYRLESKSYILLNSSENRIGINVHRNSEINKCTLNKIVNVSDFFRVTKFNQNENILIEKNIEIPVVEFDAYDSRVYEPLVVCNEDNSVTILKTKNEAFRDSQRTLIIGLDLNKLIILPSLLLDFISFASHNTLSIQNKRFVQIDIDDIFVGSKNTRMISSDVFSLIDFQENVLNKHFFKSNKHKFKFNLGFSGYYYQSGNDDENKGDQLLIGEI